MLCASSEVSPEQREEKDEQTTLHIAPEAARREVILKRRFPACSGLY